MNEAKHLRYGLLGLLFAVIALALLGFSLYVHHRASSVGAEIGDAEGRIVGAAIGSYNGITHGVEEGAEAGTDAGLSAEDTTVDVKGTLDSIGRLEVLKAGVTLKNINTIGDAYKGLYVISGDAVFSVDLSEAEISFSTDGKTVYILIPEPTLELYLDQGSTERLAQTQHFSLTVSAQDGLRAYLNSMTQTVENVKKSLSNYDSLMATARESARKQVILLASTICGDGQSVHVQFK